MAFFKKITAFTRAPFFPLRVVDTEMLPNLLLMCKLLFALLCIYGFFGHISDPHIPFMGFLDRFLLIPGVFKSIAKTIFLASGLLLVFNFRVRTMAIALGVVTITIMLSSKPVFRNHLFICGCFFLLSGLTDKKHDPWLLYVQLSLVYLGALINKVPQIDWWNGQFMQNWLANGRENQLFISLSKNFPDLIFAQFLSIGSMLVEFAIAIMLLFKKTHKIAVWTIVLFHSLLYTMTAHRFGHFYEDIVLALLLFVNWPKEKIRVYLDEKNWALLKRGLRFLNFNNTILWSENREADQNWLEVHIAKKISYNWQGVRVLLLSSSNFFVLLFFMDLLVRYLFDGGIMDAIHISLTWIAILFFIPMLWNKGKKTKITFDPVMDHDA